MMKFLLPFISAGMLAMPVYAQGIIDDTDSTVGSTTEAADIGGVSVAPGSNVQSNPLVEPDEDLSDAGTSLDTDRREGLELGEQVRPHTPRDFNALGRDEYLNTPRRRSTTPTDGPLERRNPKR
jgi:hypothetical protein